LNGLLASGECEVAILDSDEEREIRRLSLYPLSYEGRCPEKQLNPDCMRLFALSPSGNSGKAKELLVSR
jgi:hypothetical protein